MMAGKFNFTSTRAKLRIERILSLLAVETLSVMQIGERLHAAKSSVNHYIKHLRAERLIYVADYVEAGGQRPVAAFAKGDKKDAPFPKKSKADYWQEVKADPVKLASVHAIQARVRDRKRGGRELIRACRQYDSPLAELARAHIAAFPGSTTRQVCDKIGATWGGTKQAVADLKRKGVIKADKRTRAGSHWVLASREKVRHAPLVTRPQGIFAALGV